MVAEENAVLDLGYRLPGAVACGSNHTCVLFTTGSVACWGLNSAGQLGLNDTRNRGVDPRDMGYNLGVVDLGPGEGTTIYIKLNHETATVVYDLIILFFFQVRSRWRSLPWAGIPARFSPVGG